MIIEVLVWCILALLPFGILGWCGVMNHGAERTLQRRCFFKSTICLCVPRDGVLTLYLPSLFCLSCRFVSYGAVPNVKLLTYYGFALRDNPHTIERGGDPDSTPRDGDETHDSYVAKLVRARTRTIAALSSMGTYDGTVTSGSDGSVVIPVAMQVPRVATDESVTRVDNSCASLAEACDASACTEPPILSTPVEAERATTAHAACGDVECLSTEWTNTLAHIITYLDEELRHGDLTATHN